MGRFDNPLATTEYYWRRAQRIDQVLHRWLSQKVGSLNCSGQGSRPRHREGPNLQELDQAARAMLDNINRAPEPFPTAGPAAAPDRSRVGPPVVPSAYSETPAPSVAAAWGCPFATLAARPAAPPPLPPIMPTGIAPRGAAPPAPPSSPVVALRPRFRPGDRPPSPLGTTPRATPAAHAPQGPSGSSVVNPGAIRVRAPSAPRSIQCAAASLGITQFASNTDVDRVQFRMITAVEEGRLPREEGRKVMELLGEIRRKLQEGGAVGLPVLGG
ncbi:MAG: hypothetical protein HQL82_12030 [Magnetococcales bacterium]|nr:hypothetical protein [Magnetococcales bacterium]